MILATLNVRSLRTKEKELELENAIRDLKYDVLGISEMRKYGEAIIERTNGDILSYIGETKGQKGVAFIVHKYLKPNIQEIIGISKRIAILILLKNGLKITIIQVYAPTESSCDQEIEDFYDLLDDTLNT